MLDYDDDEDHEGGEDDDEGYDEEELVNDNRAYLFRDLATAFINKNGKMLASLDKDERKRAQKALAFLAYVSCVVADGDDEEPEEIARRIAEGP